jgi:hypothetical protein
MQDDRKTISFFDLCYRFLILYDNDRLNTSIKTELFERMKIIFFKTTYYSEYGKKQIRSLKYILCSREIIKNILIFMYESVTHDGKESIFFNDFQESKEIDSFLRLIYRPTCQMNVSS